MTDEVLDDEDLRVIYQKILRQAMEDYVKLQHPKYRKKKYLQEAFQNSVDMFFDTEYRFEHLTNHNDQEMSVKEFIEEALNLKRVNLHKIQDHLIEEAKQFWKEKEMHTIKIPDMICIEGVVYDIYQRDEPGYHFDYEAHELYINKKESDANEEQFILAICEAICYHLDIIVSKLNREEISKGIYRTLKINDALR